MTTNTTKIVVMAALVWGSYWAEVMAAEQIEEIIVTARFKDESVQDIGASIAAIAADTIEAEGLIDFEDIARRTANLTLFDRGPNQNEPAVRGIANNQALFNVDANGVGPLVSIFVDDIPVSAATGAQRDFNTFDFDRVEVLRGPQPTLFGEGSVGGTIRYVTRDPDLFGERIHDTRLRTSYSETKDGGGNVGIAGATSLVLIPDVLAVRGAVVFRDDDGFIDNPILGVDDVNDYESVSSRVVALWKPAQRVDVRLSAFFGRDEIGESNLVTPPQVHPADELTTVALASGMNVDDFDLYSLKIDYAFDAMTLTSITGYYERLKDVRQWNAPSQGWFCPRIAPNPCTPLGAATADDDSFTQEIRLVSDFDGPLNFTAGLFYQSNESTAFAGARAPEWVDFTIDRTDVMFSALKEFEITQYSVFGEFTFEATDNLRLIAGVRYVDEEIEATEVAATTTRVFVIDAMGFRFLPPPFATPNNLDQLIGTPFSNKESFELDEWLPRAAIEYDINDNVMVYGTVSKGVRNGNLNPALGSRNSSDGTIEDFSRLRTYDQDNVWSYELGVKSLLLNGLMTVNLALFRMDYEDPQLLGRIPDLLIVNGPDIENDGVELELQWLPTPNLSLYLNVGYLDSEFQDSMLILTNQPFVPFDIVKGQSSANTPEWNVSGGIDMNYPLSSNGMVLTGHLGYQYTSSMNATPQQFPSTEIPSQEFVNLRIGLDFEKWSIGAFVYNLTDEVEFQHVETGLPTPFLNADNQLDVNPIAGSVNRPRTIGVELSLRI